MSVESATGYGSAGGPAQQLREVFEDGEFTIVLRWDEREQTVTSTGDIDEAYQPGVHSGGGAPPHPSPSGAIKLGPGALPHVLAALAGDDKDKLTPDVRMGLQKVKKQPIKKARTARTVWKYLDLILVRKKWYFLQRILIQK